MNQSPKANDLINRAYVTSLHRNPKEQGLEGFQVDEHMEVLGEWYAWTEDGNSTSLPTYFALCSYFPREGCLKFTNIMMDLSISVFSSVGFVSCILKLSHYLHTQL